MGDPSTTVPDVHPINGTNGTNGTHGIANRPDVDYDFIVIGTGFGGIRSLHEVRKQGFSVKVFEAGSGVGGAWCVSFPPTTRSRSTVF
jgi:cyclohexanone monooxygenase